MSKDQILTDYLNVSPFGRNNKGQNIAGIQEAALGIFGKSAKDLTIPEAAFIAGLPQSPSDSHLGSYVDELKPSCRKRTVPMISLDGQHRSWRSYPVLVSLAEATSGEGRRISYASPPGLGSVPGRDMPSTSHSSNSLSQSEAHP